MYIHVITRQTFVYATTISCDDNPQNVSASDPDKDEHYVLTPKPVLRATPTPFEPEQVQYAISAVLFTAQVARFFLQS